MDQFGSHWTSNTNHSAWYRKHAQQILVDPGGMFTDREVIVSGSNSAMSLLH